MTRRVRFVTAIARGTGVLGLVLGALASVPVRAATPPFRLPLPVVKRLPNGVTVAVFRDARLPLAQVQLTVPAGSAEEDSLPAGVAQITAQMIGQSSSSRDAQAMQQDLDRAGGRLATRAGRDVGIMTATFLASELESGIDLMADAVLNALLTDAEFDHARRGARALTAGPGGAARQTEDRLWGAVFGGGPYGRATAGTAESLDRLTLADVRAFFNAHWTPVGAVIAVAGDVQPDSVLDWVSDAFGRWSARGKAAAHAPSIVSMPARGAQVVSRPDAQRCAVWVAAPGPAAGDSDEIAVALAHELATRAAGPSVHAGQSALRWGGFVWLATEAPPESLVRVARRLESALTALRSTPPKTQEVEALKRAVQSTFPMRFESLDGLVDQWSSEAALGRGFEDLVAFPDRVQAVTPASITAAARKWFDPAHLTFVVAGPPDRVRAPLATIAKVAAGGGVAARPLTPANDRRGRELVTKAVVAHGGLAALRKIKDSVLEADATVRLGSNEASAKVIQTRKEPDRMVYDLRFGDSGTREVLIGNHAWSAPIDSLQLAHDADTVGVARLRQGFRADVVHLLLDAALPSTRVLSRGAQQIDGKTYDRVDVWVADGSHRTLYFDPASRLLAGVELEGGDANDPIVPRRWYRDYRAVNGIQLPFEEDRRLGDQRVMDLKVTRYALNAGVSDALFQRPEPPLPPSAR